MGRISPTNTGVQYPKNEKGDNLGRQKTLDNTSLLKPIPQKTIAAPPITQDKTDWVI